MKALKTVSLLFLSILASGSFVFAQTTITTSPVGYVTGTCKFGSDTVVSVPLAHAPDYTGSITGTPTLSGTPAMATIVASGTTSPGWTANQYSSYYYITFTSGTLNGKAYTITANDSSSLTFSPDGDIVSGAVANDTISVTKYWTLADLFPPGTQTTLAQCTSRFVQLSSLGIPNTSGTGTGAGKNLSISQWFLIVGSGTNGKWQSTSGADATNQILYPDTFFVIRHNPNPNLVGKVVSDTTYTFTGQVNTNQVVVPLLTQSTQQQDNFVVLQRPVAVTLAQTGLSGSTGFAQSPNRFQPTDQILVYDNSTSGINKSAPYTFCMISGTWMSLSGSMSNNFVIQPGMGFIIRKSGTTGAPTAFWTNTPNY